MTQGVKITDSTRLIINMFKVNRVRPEKTFFGVNFEKSWYFVIVSLFLTAYFSLLRYSPVPNCKGVGGCKITFLESFTTNLILLQPPSSHIDFVPYHCTTPLIKISQVLLRVLYMKEAKCNTMKLYIPSLELK